MSSPDRKTSMEEAFALLAVLRQNLEQQPIEGDSEGTNGATGFITTNGEGRTSDSGTGTSPRHGGNSPPAAGATNDRKTSPIAFGKETPRISTLKDQVEQLRRDKKALLTQLDAVEAKLRESQGQQDAAPVTVQPLVNFTEPEDDWLGLSPKSQQRNSQQNKNLPPKFVALHGRVSEAANLSSGSGTSTGPPSSGATIMVWEPTDIKFNDEKVMGNLSRRYHLTLVGIPQAGGTSESGGEGPRVKAAAGGASRTTSPAVGASKRMVSPTASKRLVAPAPAVTVVRKVTPARTTGGTPAAATGSRITPSRTATTGAAATRDVARKPTPTTTQRVTPLRRASPSASVGKAPVAGAGGKKPADPQPVIRFTPSHSTEGTPEKKSTVPAGRSGTSPTASRSTPVRNAAGSPVQSRRLASPSATTKSSPAQETKAEKENGDSVAGGSDVAGSAAAPAPLSISAALAQFKGIKPNQTPRVAGDGRGPMPTRGSASTATSPARKATGPAGVGAATRPMSGTTATRGATTTATRPGATTTTRPKTVQGSYARGTLSAKPATTVARR